MNDKVILWSTGCPRCRVLEAKLKQSGIEYEERNDVDAMIAKGLTMAPALEVGGVIMGFKEATDWIRRV